MTFAFVDQYIAAGYLLAISNHCQVHHQPPALCSSHNPPQAIHISSVGIAQYFKTRHSLSSVVFDGVQVIEHVPIALGPCKHSTSHVCTKLSKCIFVNLLSCRFLYKHVMAPIHQSPSLSSKSARLLAIEALLGSKNVAFSNLIPH
jgi:hypothetical protein